MMEGGEVAEDKDSGPEVPLTFPTSVRTRIEELMGGTEQFDSEEFDAVAYINSVFPTEQSLSGVESAAARCEFRLAGVEHDIRRLVRAQAAQRDAGQRALGHTQRCIAELALQVADINKKAERSESMVREITSEIKQLDCAKSNLTAAITTLNHYHMLVGGVDALRAMTAARHYKEIVLPLQAIMEVMQHFECYRDIREVGALREQVHEIRAQLGAQILADFRAAFGAPPGHASARTAHLHPHRALADACHVLDALDPAVKHDLLNWFIALQLQEYEHLFSAEQECAWVSHVDKRYSWLKKHLLAFEDSTAALFPAHWRLSDRIATHFCNVTRDALAGVLAARRDEIDVKLLLTAIQKTCHFELLLHKRFQGTEVGGAEVSGGGASLHSSKESSEGESAALQEVRGGGEGAGPGGGQSSPWVGLIGRCFEPYLSLYISSLDANLRSLMDTFVQDAKTADVGSGSGAGAGAVISSCADLFLFYKKCLVQCARLTTGEPMLELAGVFQKYLREYASAVLQAALPRGGAGGGGGAGGAVSLVTNLHTLLRDDAHHTRYTRQEISRMTSVITTAEYCLETSVHLEQKLKEKVAPGLAERIDLRPEQDLFHKIISDCIQLLVQDLEASCAPALGAMSKVSWLHFEAVGDQSSYVTQVVMHLNNAVPVLRDHLAASRKYFTQFCIRFANSFIPKFIQNIYKCKPISTVGAEQLLLDTHMLKTALLELPALGTAVKRPAPATYTKVVIKLMTKAEMILKLVLAPLEGTGGVEGFVAQFVQLLPECSLSEFHKVLDMKGAKLSKAQLSSLDALFRETSKSVLGDAGK